MENIFNVCITELALITKFSLNFSFTFLELYIINFVRCNRAHKYGRHTNLVNTQAGMK